MTQYKIWQTYNGEPWYQSIRDHLSIRYRAIENRILQTFFYVTPDASNRDTHSFTFSSILRDLGSVFDSVIRELIIQTRKQYDPRIEGYLQFLEDMDPSLERRTVLFTSTLKTIIPFKKNSETGIPNWWHAYNDVKHSETKDYGAGNLEYAITALAALAILVSSVCHSIGMAIFTNIGIEYPENAIDVSADRLLFPFRPEE